MRGPLLLSLSLVRVSKWIQTTQTGSFENLCKTSLTHLRGNINIAEVTEKISDMKLADNDGKGCRQCPNAQHRRHWQAKRIGGDGDGDGSLSVDSSFVPDLLSFLSWSHFLFSY
jgi:hypothetical protein